MAVKRRDNGADPGRYDAFLSYSSSDERQAVIVQRFIERYRHPRSLFSPRQAVRIRVFRDKSDQGLDSDYQSAFRQRIRSTPSFLLLGSPRAARSSPVGDECRCFLDTGRDTLSLVLLEGEREEAFPAPVLARFPRAIFADVRVLKGTNWLRFWLRDRARLRTELLRTVSSILTVKSGLPVTFEDLSRRDRVRSWRRAIIATTAVIAASLVMLIQYRQIVEQRAIQDCEDAQQRLEEVVKSDYGYWCRECWEKELEDLGKLVDVACKGLPR